VTEPLTKAAQDFVWTLFGRCWHDNEGHDLQAVERYMVRRWSRNATAATPTPATLDHVWTTDDKHDYEWCRSCLLVRQRNGSSDAKPCKGPARVELRVTPDAKLQATREEMP